MSAPVTKQEPINWRENGGDGEKPVRSGRAKSEHRALKMTPYFISLVLQDDEKELKEQQVPKSGKWESKIVIGRRSKSLAQGGLFNRLWV